MADRTEGVTLEMLWMSWAMCEVLCLCCELLEIHVDNL